MNSVVRRVGAGTSLLVVLAAAGSCTGDREPAATPEPSRSTGSTATLDARPVPLEVRVTRVAGGLSKKTGATLERRIGRVVGTYFDDAFLAGDYPRERFENAFATFTSSAARLARRDERLTTNAVLGPTTTSVRATKRDVWLAVLAPNRVAAGVTARFDLRYVVDRADKATMRVQVTGRLLLTRAEDGWRIFGYDVARSAKAVA